MNENSIVSGNSSATIVDNDVHVWKSCYGWKVSTKHGDYGIRHSREDASELAGWTAKVLGNKTVVVHPE